MSDWRIDNLKRTQGATLRLKQYAHSGKSDHDHCEGCWAKFMESGGPDTLTEGYATGDDYRWICPERFHDLKDVMGWKLF